MVSGDLRFSGATVQPTTIADISGAIRLLNLPLTTDRLVVIPISDGKQVLIGTVLREA